MSEHQPIDAAYWDQRYRQADIPWDIGYISTPLKTYIDQLRERNLRILIPGGGSGYEWAYLQEQGFRQAYLLDWSASILQRAAAQHPHLPTDTLLHEDYFQHEGAYDLILEQTFFCALPPAQRPDYMQKMHDLLVPGGQLIGVLFDFPLQEQGPPWGGDEAEYRRRLAATFELRTLARCYNSIPPRQGSEYFFIARKPANR
jgi:thiopurine S-methyltransferase